MTAPATVPVLTARETEVLRRVAAGDTYVHIARDWIVQPVTVRTVGLHIIRKLGARTITHAVFLACRAGLLDGRAQRHGDHAGYARHVYAGEEPCEACREGERAYRQAYRAGRRARPAAGGAVFPQVAPEPVSNKEIRA